MNTWILVMVIFNGEAVAIQDIEFNSKEACQEAVSNMPIVETGRSQTKPYLICLNKGEKQ